MKSLLTITTFVFTLMLSSTSFADWTKVGENKNGAHYVDFGRIQKVDGFVYYWELGDYLKPNKDGDLSSELHKQGDCKLFRSKVLSFSSYKEPMGGGTGTPYTPPDKWTYPSPVSSSEVILKLACSR